MSPLDRTVLAQSLYQLVVETATNLPADVRAAIRAARAREDASTRSALALGTIAQNIDHAADDVLPICQDTGMPTFFVHTPVGVSQLHVREAIRAAVARATKDGKLRPNSVDSLTGQNSGDNLGPGSPVIHFEQWEQDLIEVKLILKGGGCENKNIQYSLPTELPGLGKAGRDLDGVRKCILHAVHQAQGQGCSAGFLGVAVGGDRTSGYEWAKHQLLRPADDVNPDPQLAELEAYVMEKANTLGIGTMGFGGQVTLLGCKVGVLNRLPASFFVSVAYNCWAYRRLGVMLDPESGEIRQWQYRVPAREAEPMAGAVAPASGRAVVLQAPITEAQIRELRVGDVVTIDGLMHTGRDAIHKHLMSHEPPVSLEGGVLYHCGPVAVKGADGAWKILAAGPTTSIREEPYQAEVIGRYGVRVVIGKGGMGAKTLAAMKDHGAVYLNAIGGAAQFYARCVDAVEGVDLMEFGVPEAMWHLRVRGFQAVVTMDSHGNSLHADVEHASEQKLAALAAPVF
ncbi:MAG: FumA C-terminus/TtdB family hydratase beta subunit [Candidatus Sericytochromatia bacterium]|nr:FumA C-terminus/TtdB family hydratase beta subunit [Candidatus Sericytochromatia bacterium]